MDVGFRFMFACLLVATTCHAQSPWRNPVARSTASRDSDLIAALIHRGRFTDAEEICQHNLRRSDPRSDDAAKWAIRLSQVKSKQQMMGEQFDDQAIATTRKPVTDFLASYPDHPRAMFLKTQLSAVAREAARHAVVVASVNPTTSDETDQLFIKLARVTSGTAELADHVDKARAAADSAADTVREHSLAADLRRLHQLLLIDVVSMSLLQTELFSPGGRDYISAANKAQQAADQALQQLPADTPARIEIERLRVQAILRCGQYDNAALQLDRLMRQVGKPFPANIRALQVRLDLARNRLPDAHQTIMEFNSSSTDASLEMDLAQLELMLASEDTGVGTWIEQIERRHGPFARRRAEAISLARLRSSDSTQMVDASIIAAQGQDWLRRGNPKRAGELLSAAARAERDPDRAITRATEAAAALIAADQEIEAAEILTAVPSSKPAGNNAAMAHLQAAHLYALANPPEAAKEIESILVNTIKQWPDANESVQARTWLIKLLKSQNRIVEAAKTATSIPPHKVTPGNMSIAGDLWMQAVREGESAKLTNIGREFLVAFRPLVQESLASRNVFRSAAAFVLDEQLLTTVEEGESDSDGDFPAKLLRFRKSQDATQLSSPPPEMIQDAVARLMRDGQRNSALRKRNASVIASWPGTSEPSLDQVKRLVWLGDVDRAVAMSKSLADESTSPGKTLERVAQLLGSSGNRTAMSEAVRFWDRLSAGLPQGTPKWHNAKLQAIKLLAATGNRDEAVKRSKYVLLTAVPDDDKTLHQYQSIVNPSGASNQ